MNNKEYNYLVTLRKNVDNKVNTISIILLFISICIYLFTGVRLLGTGNQRAVVICFVIVAFVVIWILLSLFTKKVKNYRLALLVAGVYFFFYPFNFTWLGILFVVIALLEKQAKFPQEIGFDMEGVTTNSIPSRFYPWADLSNVLIKDNLLTIDFKSNKLYQKQLQERITKGLEAEFNQFCQARLQNSPKEPQL